jgi:hypothetical protein
MGPKPPTPAAASGDLYRSRLENLLDHRHELYRKRCSDLTFHAVA